MVGCVRNSTSLPLTFGFPAARNVMCDAHVSRPPFSHACRVVGCVQDPTCKSALDCLQSCSFNDQVGWTQQQEQHPGAHVLAGASAVEQHAHVLHATQLGMKGCAARAQQLPGAQAGAAAAHDRIRRHLGPPAPGPDSYRTGILSLLQVCQYRCIVSYESPLLEQFSLCILQLHNCRNLNTKPPLLPGECTLAPSVLRPVRLQQPMPSSPCSYCTVCTPHPGLAARTQCCLVHVGGERGRSVPSSGVVATCSVLATPVVL